MDNTDGSSRIIFVGLFTSPGIPESAKSLCYQAFCKTSQGWHGVCCSCHWHGRTNKGAQRAIKYRVSFSLFENYVYTFCYILNACESFGQTSDKDEKVICYIVNSAEYCHKTVSCLLDNFFGC